MNTMRIVGDDPKKRSYVMPARVVYTQGTVNSPEALLEEKTLQLMVPNIATTTLLDNRQGDVKAGILLDFGRELSGGIRLLCPGVDGKKYPLLRIRFGESASEAMAPLDYKNAGNDHAPRDFVIPVPCLSDQEWGQTGFRFAYLELQEPGTALAIKNVLAVYSYRDIPMRGSFRSNDALLNEIFDVSAYTCHLCMQNMLWDGIKRDRLVWIGDSHPEMLTIRSVFGHQPMLEESLDAIVEATPLPNWMNTMSAYSLWWLCILKDWYHYTGDRAYPDKQKDYVLGLTRHLLTLIDEEGNIHLADYFLDWPTCSTHAGREGVQALTLLAMRAAAELIALWPEQTEIAADVQKAIEWLPKFPGKGETAKSAAAMLYLAGMLPAEKTAKLLTAGDSKGFSTFMSFYILTALARTADMTTALKLLREYYGAMLDMGATSFWEDFNIEWTKGACPIDRLPEDGEIDIHGDFGAFCYEKFRHSLCHGWSSGPVPFLMESVLGIRFETPGGSVIRVKPDLGDLQWVEASYPLPKGGELQLRCKKTADGVKTTYTAPAGITVTVE